MSANVSICIQKLLFEIEMNTIMINIGSIYSLYFIICYDIEYYIYNINHYLLLNSYLCENTIKLLTEDFIAPLRVDIQRYD